MKLILVVVSMVVILSSCQSKNNLDEIKAALALQNEKLHQVVETKNTELLHDVYATDAYFMAPGHSPIIGIDSIKLAWQESLKYVTGMKSTTLSVFGTNDLISEVGIVESAITVGDTSFVYKAKYNNVWKKDTKGQYRLQVDIWNDLQKVSQ